MTARWPALAAIALGCGPAVVPPPVSVAACTAAAPATIRIPYIAPHVGERWTYDLASELAKWNAIGSAYVPSHFQTREVVAAVDGDVVTALDVDFVLGDTLRIFGPDLTTRPAAVTGLYRLAGNHSRAFSRAGSADIDDDALAALDRYDREDVGRLDELVLMLMDKTFVQGVREHLDADSLRVDDSNTTDAWITLRGVAGGAATFDIVRHYASGDLDVEWRSAVVIDIARARVMREDSAEHSLDTGSAGSGRETIEAHSHVRFHYDEPAPPLPLRDPCAPPPITVRVARTPLADSWASRLVDDRSFELGVASRFRTETIPELGSEVNDVTLRLVELDTVKARFELTIASGSGLQRGELVVDLATGDAQVGF